MLRIERNDTNADGVVLSLHGRVAGDWADLLEQECAAARGAGLRVVLDLADVAFIGRSGLEALARLVQSGVVITGCPPLIADMLEHEGVVAARRDDDDGINPPDPEVIT